MVGLSIAVLGVRYSLIGAANGATTSEYLAIAAVSLTTMVILNVWTKGYLRMFCVLFGMAVGYGASAALGHTGFFRCESKRRTAPAAFSQPVSPAMAF